MKSFTISAAVLAAGVSAQYSAAVPSMGASSPAASMMPSYAASMPPASMPAASMPAASMPAPSVTTTITAKAGCPTGPAPDVIVTRSNVPVPSCAAGSNATKPSIVSMPGYGPPPAGASGTGSGSGSGSGAGGMGNATMTGMPPQFTGAAGKTAVSGVLAVVAGLAAWAL